MICYQSRKLKEHEKSYPTQNLKLAIVVHALKMLRYYLMGSRFLLKIEHHNLKYLFEQLNLNSRQERWMKFLSDFDFNIQHFKGKEN